jgi:tetratricopeptide (TPR) repeat protein
MQLNWQDVAICGAILVGAIVIPSATNETDAYGSGSALAMKGVYQQSELAIASLDRYDTFYRAYLRASRVAPVSFTLNDLVVSSPDSRSLKEDAAQATTALLRVVTVTPEEDGAWNSLAWLYAITGDTSKALAAEEKAILIYRYDYTYYVLLGALYERSERIDDARYAYSQALILYPRLMKSPFWHSLQRRQPLLATTALQLAVTELGQPRSSANDFDEVYNSEVRARLAAESGALDEARALVQSSNANLPNLSGMWELQGELREKEGDIQGALLDYRRAIFLDRTDPLPHERIAELDFRSSNARESSFEAEQAWRLVQHPWSPGNARRRVQYQRGHYPRDGEIWTTLATDIQPAIALNLLFTQLSGLFASQGQDDKAREMKHLAEESAAAR